MKKTVFTVAAGQKLYLDFAVNLAMSFIYWNKGNGISFVLITDLPEYIPKEISTRITVVKVNPDEIGQGFSSKLVLDKHLQSGQNLFIDADCLIYSDLNPVFDKLRGHTATVIGHTITEGIDIGFTYNVADLLQKLNLSYYPIFCGSVYYFEKNQLLLDFFDYSKNLLTVYDEIGLVRLRNKENEEPLIGLAMAKYNQMPYKDDGSIKSDRMHFDYCSKNILTGRRRLWVKNNPPKPFSSTLQEASPVVIHYNARYTEGHEYKSDVLRLRLIFKGYTLTLVNSFVFVYEMLATGILTIETIIKDTFRPIYRSLMGTRQVKKAQRM
jgi:hypothetical protein